MPGGEGLERKNGGWGRVRFPPLFPPWLPCLFSTLSVGGLGSGLGNKQPFTPFWCVDTVQPPRQPSGQHPQSRDPTPPRLPRKVPASVLMPSVPSGWFALNQRLMNVKQIC